MGLIFEDTLMALLHIVSLTFNFKDKLMDKEKCLKKTANPSFSHM